MQRQRLTHLWQIANAKERDAQWQQSHYQEAERRFSNMGYRIAEALEKLGVEEPAPNEEWLSLAEGEEPTDAELDDLCGPVRGR